MILRAQLLILRFWTYHRQKFHYFMLDFCYFCNALLLFYIFFYPNSALLFQLLFCLWYVVARERERERERGAWRY